MESFAEIVNFDNQTNNVIWVRFTKINLNELTKIQFKKTFF